MASNPANERANSSQRILKRFPPAGALAPEGRGLELHEERRAERPATGVQRFAPHVTVAQLSGCHRRIRDRQKRAAEWLKRDRVDDEITTDGHVTHNNIADGGSHTHRYIRLAPAINC